VINDNNGGLHGIIAGQAYAREQSYNDKQDTSNIFPLSAEFAPSSRPSRL
jgi:hypothetical protein